MATHHIFKSLCSFKSFQQPRQGNPFDGELQSLVLVKALFCFRFSKKMKYLIPFLEK